MFLSIIIPVYNSESYLPHCLDSVLKDPFDDFEVLLIDDCSSDSSASICKQYANLDPRVKYHVRSSNGGTSAARNSGLELSSGKYITFLDNDDWWHGDNIVSGLLSTAVETQFPDVICFDTYDYWSNSQELRDHDKSDLFIINGWDDLAQITKHLIRRGGYCSAVWSKLIKRELITEHNIQFPMGERNEDSDFSLQLLYWAQSYGWHDTPFYVWRRNSGTSQSAQALTSPILLDLLRLLDRHIAFAKQGGFPTDAVLSAHHYAAYLYVIALSYLHLVSWTDGRDKKESIKRLKAMSWLLKYDWNPRVHLVKIVYAVLGLNVTSRCLSAVMSKERKSVTQR